MSRFATAQALMNCRQATLNERLLSKLIALGVSAPCVAGTNPFDCLRSGVVVSLGAGRFEFARDLRDATGAKEVVIIPARDEDIELVDLVALDLNTGAITTWLGRVALLGQQWLSAPTLGEPLSVHETPLDWLRAGMEGLYVVHPGRAARLLAARSIVVKDVAFGASLRAALRLEPTIFVSDGALS